MPAHDFQLNSLTLATDIDVLPDTSVVEQRDRYLVVRTPSNPTYYWGNFLVYPDAPAAGDRLLWEADFAREIAARNPGTEHVALVWDRTDGVEGAAHAEFAAVGYDIDRAQALTATPAHVRAHARASDAAVVRALDLDGAEAWEEVIQLRIANRPERVSQRDAAYRTFVTAHLDDVRTHFADGRGAWYGAWVDGELAASLGIVVTNGRARFQSVDTLDRFRRRGIASKLVVDAARDAAERFDVDQFVIVADTDYHALGLYTSLGFASTERGTGVCWHPRLLDAGRHPTFVADRS